MDETTNPTTTDAAPEPNSGTAVQPPTAPDNNPVWLPERLERAKQAAVSDLLSKLGVDSPDAIKTMLDDYNKRKQADMSETERLQNRLKELEPVAAQFEGMKATVQGLLDNELTRVPADKRPDVDIALAAVPSLEGKLTVLRTLVASFVPTQPPLAQPTAPITNAGEGSRQTSSKGITDDERQTFLKMGWSQEDIDKYYSKEK